jgi:hypothetical protein
MSTRSTRVLHRMFLACILFALLLIPQIGATRTALAAKPIAFPENDCPTASVLLTSIKINIDASGTSTSGQAVFAPGAVLNVY